MILRIKIVILTLLLPFLTLSAQKLKKADKITLANLETHIRFLADDKLEGRRTGTPGEQSAGDYISIGFSRSGLQPKGDNNGWKQSFEVNEGRQISRETFFMIDNNSLVINKEFFPLAFSAVGSAAGTPAIALQEKGDPWFLDLKDLLEANKSNPHFDLPGAIRSKAKECVKKGATALILYNTSKIADNLAFDPKDRSEPAVFPLFYITREGRKKYLKDESASLDIKLKVGFTEKKRTGHNIIGYLDNGAASTVVIGAHYDHLGYGEDSNGLYRGPERQIFNGADDNASGVAAIIELARLLKASGLKGNNYLFIAFSGEELGLFGSKYFVDHPTIDLSKVNYMINLDMVGRLKDSTHALNIGGYGSSPIWAEACDNAQNKKFFSLHYDSSGVGPSDHTSFYRKDIPVLFFFTGLNADYHKPTDDPDKINYIGELQVVKYVYQIVEDLNKKGKLAFTKTKEMQMGGPRFTVTLGIMPDYTFSGNGVRADGVSDGRPAQRAGLKAGDVIVQLGDYPVSSLEKYMDALSRFQKGDTTIVRYKRGNDTLQSPVQF
ncbi:MAG: M20/M25/M40 family metallo-hydrolase [Chitinophagaceae bacterium]|nr:M20/M25/M40 family metallo-hydrolase [Chitinophagaceae bacterium]